MTITKASLDRLFDKAIKNHLSSTSYASGKAFELYVMLRILNLLSKAGFKIKLNNPSGLAKSEIKVAGGPAYADKSQFSYFTAKSSELNYEVWISVEVMSLSHYHAAPKGVSMSAASYHEIDVAVFKQLPAYKTRPSHQDLIFAASCKCTKFLKQYLREALGLRRETALWRNSPNSRAPWFKKSVPAAPSSPFVLFSNDINCRKYRQPVDTLGVYIAYLRFPIIY